MKVQKLNKNSILVTNNYVLKKKIIFFNENVIRTF